MKYLWWIPAAMLLLSGCTPSPSDETEVVNEEEAETAIIPSIQVDDRYYRTLLPYKESPARGLILNRLNSRYDIEEAETGLLRLSQRQFSPDDYYFQEGQKITGEEIRSWLSRESEENPAGLNPADPRTEAEQTSGERPPAEILAHIIEQNYLVKTDEDTIRLGGVSIGLALNAIYYGNSYEEEIPAGEMEAEGKRLAEIIVSRLREKEGMADIPIVVGLFEQNPRNAITPGTYFMSGASPAGSTEIPNWQPIDEEYVIFPTSSSSEKYRETDTAFRNFKQDVEEYFSNFTSVIGTGFYQGDQIQELTIDIPIEFYSSTEIIGFTQYLTGLVMDHFPENTTVEISVTSTRGPETLIVRNAGQREPVVHIYQ